MLPEETNLPVLLGDQLLVHRGDLDEHVLARQIEVGSEELRGVAIVVEVDGKLARLVLPLEVVEVEKQSELPLALMGKLDVVSRLPVEVLCRCQLACASTVSVSPATDSGKSRWISPTSSSWTGPTAIPKTP